MTWPMRIPCCELRMTSEGRGDGGEEEEEGGGDWRERGGLEGKRHKGKGKEKEGGLEW